MECFLEEKIKINIVTSPIESVRELYANNIEGIELKKIDKEKITELVKERKDIKLILSCFNDDYRIALSEILKDVDCEKTVNYIYTTFENAQSIEFDLSLLDIVKNYKKFTFIGNDYGYKINIMVTKNIIEFKEKPEIFKFLQGFRMAEDPVAFIKEQYSFNQLDGIPELKRAFDFKLEKETIGLHTLYTIKELGINSDDIRLRYAALLHDIGQPITKATSSKGKHSYTGHPLVSEVIAESVMSKGKVNLFIIKDVLQLIKLHETRIPETEEEMIEFIKKNNLDKKQMARLIVLKNAISVAKGYEENKKIIETLKNIKEVDVINTIRGNSNCNLMIKTQKEEDFEC